MEAYRALFFHMHPLTTPPPPMSHSFLTVSLTCHLVLMMQKSLLLHVELHGMKWN